MKKVIFGVLLVLVAVGILQPTVKGKQAADLLQPGDLTYLGAFRLPASSGAVNSWAWGGYALTYYPSGDPSGPDDGYPGSLFGTGHAWQYQVTEIDIPVPVISNNKNLSQLNRASAIQGFQDIVDVGSIEIPRVGLAYLPKQGSQSTDKLYYCWGGHYSDPGDLTHGWFELNLANPQVKKAWRLDNPHHEYNTNDYIFDIPTDWAAAHTPGKLLATGRFRDGGWSGQGPGLFAIGPWNQGNPPASGTVLQYKTLIRYTSTEDFGEGQHIMTDYHNSDEWSGAAWLTAGSKSAVVFVGTKGVGDCWYGDANGPCDDCPGERGWWSTAFEGQIIFYDPDDLAAVAAGTKQEWEPQPYASLNVDQYLYHIQSTQQWYHLGAACFDRGHGFLYVLEPYVDTEDSPIVHVWKVAGGGSPTPTLTVGAPNGGENWAGGSTENIQWSTTGSVGNVKIEYSSDNGGSWTTVAASESNDGSYSWAVPNISSSQCLVRVGEADGAPIDTSDAVFTISAAAAPSITVTSPNGGENWTGGSTQNIQWSTTGSVGNVKIEYSSDNGGSWTTVAASESNDGDYSWTVPNISSSQCLVRVGETDGEPIDTSNAVFTISTGSTGSAVIALNRTRLNFGAVVSGGAQSDSQTFYISNDGSGGMTWSLAGDAGWLGFTPASGTSAQEITVSVDPSGMGVGTYNGTITATSPDASNSPQTVAVFLRIYQPGATEKPRTYYSSPANEAEVYSNVPFTGWAVDDIGIDKITLFRRDGQTLIRIGDAVLTEGTRPDVESAYPDYPHNYRAGWGYMMLTNFLPNRGNGSYNIVVKAYDEEGNEATIGERTIICDNTNAVKPLGTLDFPTQGEIVSGSEYLNWGWVLTPPPNWIPYDGSTIGVYINGQFVGRPHYGNPRDDISRRFPEYLNSGGAVGLYILDTTAFPNGLYEIAWFAVDNAGNQDGLGSRYITIRNSKNQHPRKRTAGTGYPGNHWVKKQAAAMSAGAPPSHRLTIKELDLVEMDLKIGKKSSNVYYSGYSLVGGQLRALPIGSTLDGEKGVFYWHPAPGFIGEYHFLFIQSDQKGLLSWKKVTISIEPKFSR